MLFFLMRHDFHFLFRENPFVSNETQNHAAKLPVEDRGGDSSCTSGEFSYNSVTPGVYYS